MLSLKLVRSLVLGETINKSLLFNQSQHDDDVDGDGDVNHVHHSHHQSSSSSSSSRRRRRRKGGSSSNTITPLLYFLPTKEIIKDTYRLATIARDMGMDLNPNPSLSHIIFSWPPSSPSSSSSSSSFPSLWSSSSSTWSLSGDAVPLPFPSLTSASSAHLRCFVRLSRGFFKLVFCKFNNSSSNNNDNLNTSNWDCSSLSLFSRVTGDRIDSMDSFSRVLAGMGWTLFKTKNNPSLVSGDLSSCCPNSVYLFRKVDCNRVQARRSDNGASAAGEFRFRELRLPTLDFRNAPLRILQYILIMTDDVFYLA